MTDHAMTPAEVEAEFAEADKALEGVPYEPMEMTSIDSTDKLTFEDAAAKAQVEIGKRFKYHTPKGDQPERYQKLRAKAKELAEMIEALCPDSREKALASTNLEQAVMWANASIARRE